MSKAKHRGVSGSIDRCQRQHRQASKGAKAGVKGIMEVVKGSVDRCQRQYRQVSKSAQTGAKGSIDSCRHSSSSTQNFEILTNVCVHREN